MELDGVMRKNVERYGDDRRVRLVVKGWSMRDPPVKVMSVLTEAVKVEACYDRATADEALCSLQQIKPPVPGPLGQVQAV